MATFLLIAIYVMMIGLGLPDSTLGAVWPSVYQEFNVPVSYASFITVLIALFTVLSSYFSARLVKKLGIGLVTLISTILCCFALLGFSLSKNVFALAMFAIPCGLGAGCIDAVLNDYISKRYSSFCMSLNHCFYGVGVMLSPYLISYALSVLDWRFGYRLVFYAQLLVVAVAFIALPLWNKVKSKNGEDDKKEIVIVPYKKMIKTPVIVIGWVVFFSTCALEFTCGTWACTYLVHLGMDNQIAAKYLSIYYLGMTLGRFIFGFISKFISNKKIVLIGYSLVFVAIVAFFMPLPVAVKGLFLFLIGFGNGPSFPNLVYITPKIFGEKYSQSITGSWLVMANLGILIMPPLFGVIGNNFGLRFFPLYIACLFLIILAFTLIYFYKTKNYKFSIDENKNMGDN